MENFAAPSQEEQEGVVEEKIKKGVPYEQLKVGVVKETTPGERRCVLLKKILLTLLSVVCCLRSAVCCCPRVVSFGRVRYRVDQAFSGVFFSSLS